MTPTMIRSLTNGTHTGVVLTVIDYTGIKAWFQVYDDCTIHGGGLMYESCGFDDEQRAVKEFDSWRAGRYEELLLYPTHPRNSDDYDDESMERFLNDPHRNLALQGETK